MLSFLLLKKMSDLGIRVKNFNYPFENNMQEKLFVLGCKSFFPNSEIIAYQHTAWYQDQLGMSIGKNEKNLHPTADKIICSGTKYLDILENQDSLGKN